MSFYSAVGYSQFSCQFFIIYALADKSGYLQFPRAHVIAFLDIEPVVIIQEDYFRGVIEGKVMWYFITCWTV